MGRNLMILVGSCGLERLLFEVEQLQQLLDLEPHLNLFLSLDGGQLQLLADLVRRSRAEAAWLLADHCRGVCPWGCLSIWRPLSLKEHCGWSRRTLLRTQRTSAPWFEETYAAC